MLGGIPDPFSGDRFRRSAQKYGQVDAAQMMRDEITDPDERDFYNQQNVIADHFIDNGARVRELRAPMEYDPMGAESMNALRGLEANEANLRAGLYQDRRRGR